MKIVIIILVLFGLVIIWIRYRQKKENELRDIGGLFPHPDSKRNFKEDYDHADGYRMNYCKKCKMYFLGISRRHKCRNCE
jgi:hypothetical protein